MVVRKETHRRRLLSEKPSQWWASLFCSLTFQKGAVKTSPPVLYFDICTSHLPEKLLCSAPASLKAYSVKIWESLDVGWVIQLWSFLVGSDMHICKGQPEEYLQIRARCCLQRQYECPKDLLCYMHEADMSVSWGKGDREKHQKDGENSRYCRCGRFLWRLGLHKMSAIFW